MLKNMKVKNSLFVGFGVTITVSLAIIISSIIAMNVLSKGYNDVIDRNVRANVLITTIRLESNIAARNIRDIALIPDDPKNPQLEAKARECLLNMENDIRELEKVYPLDKADLTSYLNAAHNWMAVAPTIIDEVNADRVKEAIDMIQFTCTPALEEMASLAQVIDDGIVAAQDEAVDTQKAIVNVCSLIFIVATLVATLAVIYIIRIILSNILPPVAQVQEALMGFSKGDFTIPVEYESRSELGDMCYAMRKSQKILNAVVEDECYLMTEFANGNFGARTRAEASYVGRLKDVLMSMREMTIDVSTTVVQIVESADQLDAGSNQVSDGAQALSQGATEQAAATEELSGAIAEVNRDIQSCYDKAIDAKKITDE
ncbi:MAG: methyl-accepting chemotaxis protein, partial [Oscillospiraceae bacterium]|nr:methyl-accepting chemotaxis protein [Oscillospiraceae bacterium]